MHWKFSFPLSFLLDVIHCSKLGEHASVMTNWPHNTICTLYTIYVVILISIFVENHGFFLYPLFYKSHLIAQGWTQTVKSF